jgi:septal ring factor EnvC (AmiA/AmiB activator)
MKENDPPEFKFSAEEPEAEEFIEDEMTDLRLEKLSHRITLITILLPCLLAAAVYLGYRDLTGRVSRTQDSGSIEIQKLSRQMETLSKEFNEKLVNFSTTLSGRDRELVSSMSTKLSVVNKAVKSLKSDLQKTRDSVKKLAAQKVDKKSQAAAIAAINAELKPLARDVKSISDLRVDLKNAQARVDKLSLDLTALVDADKQLRKSIDEIKSSVTNLSGRKIDRDLMELELLKLKKQWQVLLLKTQDNLTRRLDAIQKQIDGINKISRFHKKSMKSATKKTPSSGSKSKSSGADTSGIVEQDIVE